MKKNTLIPPLFVELLVLVSCRGTSKSKTTAGADTVRMEKLQPGTIHLTRVEFLKKMADYENHSKEWEYLDDKPAIVSFCADWCGPCKMVTPIPEELSKEYTEKIYIYKADVDKKPELAEAFGIRSILTLWFVPIKGEPQVSMEALPKEQLKGYIDKVLLRP